MIAEVSAWVRGIVFIVLFAAFLELLLPSGSMRSFVRVILGLLIMMAVLSPVLDFLDKTHSVPTAAFDGVPGNYPAPAALVGTDTREKQIQLAREYYAKDLARQIRATVLSVGDVKYAQVTVNLDNSLSREAQNPKLRAPVPQVTKVIILVEPENPALPSAVQAIKIDTVQVSAANSSTKKPAGETAGKPAGETAGETAGKSAGETVGKSAGETVGKPAGETVEKSAGETVGKPAGETVGKPAGETVGKSAGETKEESAQQVAKTALTPLVKEKIERAVSQLYHISLESIEVRPFSAGKG